MAIKTVSMRELESLLAEGKRVKIKTDSGFQPIVKFYNNGEKEVFRINGLLDITDTHNVFIEGKGKVPVSRVEVGDLWLHEDGAVTVESIVSQGIRQVGDLQVDHPDHRYYANGFLVSNCGHCSTASQVLHVSGKGRVNEIGHEQIQRLDKIKRDDRIAQKILVEVYQEGGVYSAMEPGWFRNAVNRALLMAGHQLEWDLVESLIYEKYSHTRQLYRIKDDNFKSLVAGKSVYEVSFNSKFVFTPAHLDQLMEKVNQFTTKGWKITNLKLVPSDFILKNNLKYAITTFRFDSRKVNLDTVNLKLLEERISTFRSRDVKYKRQIRINKQVVRNQVVSFDKSKVLSLSCGTGRNQYETVLRVFSEIEDVHPLIFLAGFLSDKKAPKAYAGLLGTDISVEGFYTAPSTTANIFDIGGSHEHGTECPKCGGQKALNVISGLPFGEAENEQDPDLMHKHGKVCQNCWQKHAQ